MSGEEGEKGREVPELLAPAGSFDALRAAVGAGADAVYLGGKRFGARAYADNFDDAGLVDALAYAHRADVRVYVTVNTLVADEELAEAGRYLLSLYEEGVDGVLVQDPGLIRFARKRIPGLLLHGSTQMTLHNHAGVEWAARMGLKRVVLARELSAPAIHRIAEHLHGYGIGLEVFVHGALCYSYSGQCLLSSVIGGRSGNRGRCAQPCRKSYLLVEGSPDAYDRIPSPQARTAPTFCLSTRDLSTYLHLEELLRLPVDALKIEGRMKSPEYVATVVRVYRSAIDQIREGVWKPRSEDLRDLLLAFNRGATGGHLFAEPVMGVTRPDHQGLQVGEVIEFIPSTRRIALRLSGDTVPEAGDGLLICSAEGEECGLRIMEAPVREGPVLYLRGPPVQKGSPVVLTSRAALERGAAEAMKRPGYRPLPVDVTVSWKDRRALFAGTLQGHKDLPFRYETSIVWEEARTRPLTPDQIIGQLQKSGGTSFVLRIFLHEYPGGLFLPLSGLNALRRDLLAHLGSVLEESHRPPPDAKTLARDQISSYHPAGYPQRIREGLELTVYVSSLEGVKAALEGGADRVCLESDGSLDTKAGALCHAQDIPLYDIWPRILPDSELERRISHLGQEEGYPFCGRMVGGVGIAEAIHRKNSAVHLRGSADLNVWNHCSIRAWAPHFESLVLSPELSLAWIRDLSRRIPPGCPELECIVQGNLEVVISENCPDERIRLSGTRAWGLQDIRDRIFPVRRDEEGRTHIYNAVETSYIDHLPELREVGIHSIALEGRHRSPAYVRDMTSLYREALDRLIRGENEVDDLKEEIRRRSRGGITLGPLLKGLKEET